ncbi:SMP-30/gluconolactonase/LRE family protein [Spirillospora sp. CA-294931]|uniref:SMP-30/gluconolactonase/LRE family protein n=1 Tax=Spirillospora sp. CA-294931 TaxID=3240042 RepID=UPI003D8BB2DB
MTVERRSVLKYAAVGVTAAATGTVATTSAHADAGWPTTIALPNGFRPEGIAIGSAPLAYFGSLGNGAIYRADLRTGRGRVVSPGQEGRAAVGIKLDQRGRLFVSGGPGGDARVVDVRTGAVLATYRLASGGPAFVNDVVLGRGGAWFTDSYNGVVYGLPLGPGGRLPGQDAVVRLPLGGEWEQVPGEGVFNSNGIAVPRDRSALLVMQQQHGGHVFRVDSRSGRAERVRLAGAPALERGDGLLVHRDKLYIAQNGLHCVDVFRLARDGRTGTYLKRVTNEGFDFPTTVAAFGRRLYVANARFATPPTPTTPYAAVAVPLV